MAPLTRRRKVARDAAAPAIDPADRLSKLPHEILARIISFLPAQEAVQTCILGRTWRDVWKIAPRLLILIPTGTGCFVHQVRKFLDHLLRVRLDGCAPLDVSEIAFNRVHQVLQKKEKKIAFNRIDDDVTNVVVTNVDEYTSSVNSWIRLVLKCQVQSLRVKTRLGGCYYLELSESPFVSQHLTRLELQGVEFEGGRLNLEGCPALEHLEMAYCRLPGVVTSPSLKRLNIKCCDAGYDRVRIRAPRLVSLWLMVRYNWIPQLESMPDLVRAHVEISVYTGLLNSDEAMCNLLQGLAEAKVLEMTVDLLSRYVLNAIFQRDLRPRPIFSKLKTLVLSEDGCSDQDDCPLACILECAPFLEKLTLEFSHRFFGKYKAELKGHLDETVKSTMTSQHLKIVEVKCQLVDQRVPKLLKFFATLNIYFQITLK